MSNADVFPQKGGNAMKSDNAPDKYQHKLLGSLLSLLKDRHCSNNSRLKPRECDADVLSKEIPSSFNNV